MNQNKVTIFIPLIVYAVSFIFSIPQGQVLYALCRKHK